MSAKKNDPLSRYRSLSGETFFGAAADSGNPFTSSNTTAFPAAGASSSFGASPATAFQAPPASNGFGAGPANTFQAAPASNAFSTVSGAFATTGATNGFGGGAASNDNSFNAPSTNTNSSSGAFGNANVFSNSSFGTNNPDNSFGNSGNTTTATTGATDAFSPANWPGMNGNPPIGSSANNDPKNQFQPAWGVPGTSNNGPNNNGNNNNGGNGNFPFTFRQNEGKEKTSHVPGNVMNDFLLLGKQYNPNAEECRLETILYNRIPATEKSRKFEKPPIVKPQVWDVGVKQNPDKDNLIPVAIRGYSQLYERAAICMAAHTSYRQAYEDLREKQSAMTAAVQIHIKHSIEEIKQTQIDLSFRLLVVMRDFSCQAAKHYNSVRGVIPTQFTAQEQDLHDILTKIFRDLKTLATEVSRSCDVITLISRNKARNMDSTDLERSRGAINIMSPARNTAMSVRRSRALPEPDQRNLQKCFKLLKTQQQMVQHLMSTLNHDCRDLAIMLPNKNLPLPLN